MARPEFRKASKDYPDSGIKKGEEYWFVRIKTGPRSSRTLRQKAPFKPSQLTSSEFLQAAYGIEESIAALTDLDDLDGIIDEVRSLGSDTEEKFNNMPEGLQQGETGQMLERRKDACETYADELEEAKEAEDFEEPEEDDDGNEPSAEYIEDARQEWVDERLNAIRELVFDFNS